ncbi:MAG: hypothetical protein ACUZ8H_16045 [Candidatus Anammoxibacter sp.]
MAFTASDLALAQAKLQSNFASAELRDIDNATFKEFIRNTEIMVPSWKELRKRQDRTVTAYFVDRQSRSLGGAESHNHTGTHGSSTAFTPTWVPKSDKFAISLKQGDNNIFNNAEQLESEFTNVFLNFNTGNESLAINHLFANRTTVNGVTAEGTFNAAQDVFEVTEATEGARFAQIMGSTMRILKYTGSITYFCDAIAFNKFENQAAQGAQNSTNSSFQFQGKRFVHSIELEALAGALGVPYIKGFVIGVPDGTIAGMSWIPKQNREGVMTTVNKYASIINPADSLSYALHSYELRADGTGTGGFRQDVLTEVQVWNDISFDHAPLTVAGETTLIAFALV